MQSNFHKYSLLATFFFTCSLANAGFVFTQPARVYGIGIDGGASILRVVDTPGYFNESLALSLGNRFGTTSVKIDVESTLDENVYKSATLINLETEDRSPRKQYTGGSTFYLNSFIIDELTTVRISYQVIKDSDFESSYSLRLTGPDGTLLIDERVQDTQSGSYTITLQPGGYSLDDSTFLIGLGEDQIGEWSISTTMSMTVVPSPASVLAFSPCLLVITRRNRA